MFKNITIGSDPEFFIFKEDNVVSSIGLIEGTKHSPEIVNDNYGILKDNVLIEGNIPPAHTKEEFVHNFSKLKMMMSAILAEGGYHLISRDSVKFPEELLSSTEARTFGCAPYYNAWTLSLNTPKDLVNLPYRVAGTHIHIGYEYTGELSRDYVSMYITRAFDYFVVYPSRLEYNDLIRSRYYGDYGNFRMKPYGVECRSLGGYFSQDKYLGWIYDQVIKTLKYCEVPENIELLDKVTSPENNVEKNYEILNIDLKEQLYGDTDSIVISPISAKEAL